MKNIDEPRDGAGRTSARRSSVSATIAIVATLALALGIVITVHNANQPTVASPRPASTGSPAEPSDSPTATGGDRWKPRPTKKPAGINKKSETGPGLVFEIADMKATQGKAKLPGDIAGPAIKFTIKVTNTGDDAADLSTTVVSVFYGKDKIPALQLNRQAAPPLPKTLKAGRSAAGAYEFTVPVAERDQVLITVDHSVDSSIVAFEGSAPQ